MTARPDLFDFEKLAREIVAGRLLGAEAPGKAAAEIAKKIIATGVTSTKVRQEPKATVAAVCRGTMSGLLVLNAPLPQGAVSLLKMLPEAAHDVHLSSDDMMTWGMVGIADAAAIAGVDACDKVHDAIEAEFHGAGEVFRSLCNRATGRR